MAVFLAPYHHTALIFGSRSPLGAGMTGKDLEHAKLEGHVNTGAKIR